MTGEELFALPKALGWTQAKFGEAIGVNQSHLSMIEAGDRIVTDPIAAAARMLAKIKRV